jgi:hypothetical protein
MGGPPAPQVGSSCKLTPASQLRHTLLHLNRDKITLKNSIEVINEKHKHRHPCTVLMQVDRSSDLETA